MPAPPDPDALLSAALQGDREALVALLEAAAPRVRARIEPKIDGALRTSLDADDVMQVTYMEAVTRLSTFKGGGYSGFLAWLSRLAENNLIDAVRAITASTRPDPHRRVTPTPTSPDQSVMTLMDCLGVTSTTPSRFAAKHEAARFLDRTLAKLPPDYEKVVRMYDLEGKSAPEVAAAMGRSEGAVFMLRARAHERLRDLMGPAGNFFSTPGA